MILLYENYDLILCPRRPLLYYFYIPTLLPPFTQPYLSMDTASISLIYEKEYPRCESSNAYSPHFVPHVKIGVDKYLVPLGTYCLPRTRYSRIQGSKGSSAPLFIRRDTPQSRAYGHRLT